MVYKQNPLQEVLCQLKFPTILEIKTVDPAAFQKRIRSGYPLYSREGDDGWLSGLPPGVPKEVTDIVSQFLVAKRGEDVTHKFLTENSARFISLAPEFLAVTETEYTRWERFRDEVAVAKEALDLEYKPPFYSRIGLRYVDIIDKAVIGLEEATWDSLINPAVIGMLGARDVGERVRQINTVALIELGDNVVPGGQVRVRHGIVRGKDEREGYKIDVDLFTDERSTTTDVIRILEIFNRLAGHFFRWAITDRLRDALGPRELR